MSVTHTFLAAKPRIIFSFDGIFKGYGEEEVRVNWSTLGQLHLQVMGRNHDTNRLMTCHFRFERCFVQYAGSSDAVGVQFKCEKYDPIDALVEFQDSQWASERAKCAGLKVPKHFAIIFMNDLNLVHLLADSDPAIQVCARDE